jgi:hypothetical protein|nr:MAG TPA: hypothetical protein [Caudoviricetes sp.]
MYFKDLKQNYPVFILDKQNLTLTQGKVVSVGFPRMELNPTAGKSGMVVDVSIEADGKTANYVIPETLSVTYAGNLVLSVDRQGLAGEVESMKTSAEQALASVEHQRRIVEKSTGLLAELNPAFREKQETEQRFSKIESSMNEVKQMLSRLISSGDKCN